MASIAPFSLTDRALPNTVSRVMVRGGIVGIPTETYYGLGVSPFDARAVQRLLRIKGRPDGKPILVLIGARSQLASLTSEVSPIASFLMDTFWPGPLTILFPALSTLPVSLTAGTGTVGVRLTSCAPLAELLRSIGPMTGTSANHAGDPPAQSAAEVERMLGREIALILDAGLAPGGLPSTVIDARHDVRLIREGAVTRQALENVLQTRGMTLT